MLWHFNRLSKKIFKHMKIAVIIYGHMRSFEFCFPNLHKFLLKPLNPDVFIHTWSLNESSTPSWHKSHRKNIHKINFESIISRYNPTSFIIENQPSIESSFNKVVDGVNFFGFNCMYHSLSKANSLKQTEEVKRGCKYDIVVKIRPDILINKPIPFNFKTFVSDNDVYIAGNKKNGAEDSIYGYAAVDILNISSSTSMDIICNLSYYVYEFFNSANAKQNGFSNFILKQKLKPIMLEYAYNKDWQIIR